MRQRREDIRNIALIVGSGCVGAVAIGVGWAAATSRDAEFRVQHIRHIEEFHITAPAAKEPRPTSIRIRGSASLEAVGSPAIYVDGVRVDGGLEGIEPEDIDQVDVLKGPAAKEKYGGEGENGVIIVTTKTGKKRKGGGER